MINSWNAGGKSLPTHGENYVNFAPPACGRFQLINAYLPISNKSQCRIMGLRNLSLKHRFFFLTARKKEVSVHFELVIFKKSVQDDKSLNIF